MYKGKSSIKVRVLLIIVLVLSPYLLNIPKIAEIQADSKVSSNESLTKLYKELKLGKRITPDNSKHKVYITPKRPTVYLTFDDGPSKETPKVLEILKKHEIKATFFVVGAMAEKYPKLVKQVVNEGHALGNHSYNHVYNQLYGNPAEFWQQIQRTEGILFKITGIKPGLIRAPGGTYKHFDAFYYYDMERAGYSVMDWNIDSGDSKRVNVPASEIITKIKKSPLKHEVILLLHDGTGHTQSVEALPEIITYFQKKGYEFAALSMDTMPVQAPLAKINPKSTYSYNQFLLQHDIVSKYIEKRYKEQIDVQPIITAAPCKENGENQVIMGCSRIFAIPPDETPPLQGSERP